MIPTKIDVHKSENLLKIVWDDGHISEYTFNLLRAACPCAECRGGHENMHAEPTSEMFEIMLPDSPAVHLEDLSLVGSYGLSIQWQDGHAHGIFHWQYLRKLCTCDRCQLDR